MNLIKSTSTFSIFTFISRILGYIRDFLIAITLGSGPLSEIVIDNGGSGYSVGDKLVFNNTGTEGVNAEGFVSVVNGAIAGDDGTNADHITLEDGTQRGDHYYGDKIVLEPETLMAGRANFFSFASLKIC